MATKLHNILGRGPVAGSVGLEIEMEAEQPLPSVAGSWRTVPDNSLRGYSSEYVSRSPFTLDSVEKNLSTLFKKIEPAKLKPTARTSIHVHVNVDDMDPRQIYNAITYCWLAEPFLLDTVADHRRCSSFALPLDKSDYIIDLLRKDLDAKSFFQSFTADAAKYTAIALHHIIDLGSIEFRSKEGTTDQKDIWQWTHDVYRIVNMSRQTGADVTPTDILDKASRKPEDFLKSIRVADSQKNVKRLYSRILLMYDRMYVDWKELFDKFEKDFGRYAPRPQVELALNQEPNIGAIHNANRDRLMRGILEQEQILLQRRAPRPVVGPNGE